MKRCKFRWLLVLVSLAVAFIACHKDHDEDELKFKYDTPYAETIYCRYYEGMTYASTVSFLIANPTRETLYWMGFDLNVYIDDELVFSEPCEVGSLSDKTELVVPARNKLRSAEYYVPNLKVKFWKEDIYSFKFENIQYRTLESDRTQMAVQAMEVEMKNLILSPSQIVE